MAKINILDKHIFNRIAAGEVVEKPASVVKELVENSIDAGATKISIEVLNGGISRIRVGDNGSGIERGEMTKVFLPHATSKIHTVEDLDRIGTLGFRGEALSSIASVSKITLLSKTTDSDHGSKITAEGGEVNSPEDVACTDGTSITVEDLFYCVPARAKFLRKPKLEEAEITNYVMRLILSHPNVTFRYTADGKQIYNSPGTNLYDAIYSVYGKSVIDNIIEVNFKNEDMSIKGYIGKTGFTKPNRTYQTLIVNCRYVINQTVSTAVYKAYEPFLMKGNFPFFVLELYLPLDRVDVNVHPNKLDIKFENSNKIFIFLLNEISKILLENTGIKKFEQYIEESDPILYQPISKLSKDEGKNYDEKSSSSSGVEEVSLTVEPLDNQAEQDKINKLKDNLQQFIVQQDTDFKVFDDGGFYNKMVQQALKTQESKQESMPLSLQQHKIVGVIFNTYIIVEQGNEIFFIDQHAAHERILYDKFKADHMSANIVAQPLLVPHIIEVNPMESAFLDDNISLFSSLGFQMEKFGLNSYKIQEVPLLLKDIKIVEFFNKVLADITNKAVSSKAEALEDYLARSACRSAVKANDILTSNEIEVLLKMLTETKVLLCPHGRPIIIRLTDKDIEKWFKRIV